MRVTDSETVAERGGDIADSEIEMSGNQFPDDKNDPRPDLLFNVRPLVHWIVMIIGVSLLISGALYLNYQVAQQPQTGTLGVTFLEHAGARFETTAFDANSPLRSAGALIGDEAEFQDPANAERQRQNSLARDKPVQMTLMTKKGRTRNVVVKPAALSPEMAPMFSPATLDALAKLAKEMIGLMIVLTCKRKISQLLLGTSIILFGVIPPYAFGIVSPYYTYVDTFLVVARGLAGPIFAWFAIATYSELYMQQAERPRIWLTVAGGVAFALGGLVILLVHVAAIYRVGPLAGVATTELSVDGLTALALSFAVAMLFFALRHNKEPQQKTGLQLVLMAGTILFAISIMNVLAAACAYFGVPSIADLAGLAAWGRPLISLAPPVLFLIALTRYSFLRYWLSTDVASRAIGIVLGALTILVDGWIGLVLDHRGIHYEFSPHLLVLISIGLMVHSMHRALRALIERRVRRKEAERVQALSVFRVVTLEGTTKETLLPKVEQGIRTFLEHNEVALYLLTQGGHLELVSEGLNHFPRRLSNSCRLWHALRRCAGAEQCVVRSLPSRTITTWAITGYDDRLLGCVSVTPRANGRPYNKDERQALSDALWVLAKDLTNLWYRERVETSPELAPLRARIEHLTAELGRTYERLSSRAPVPRMTGLIEGDELRLVDPAFADPRRESHLAELGPDASALPSDPDTPVASDDDANSGEGAGGPGFEARPYLRARSLPPLHRFPMRTLAMPKLGASKEGDAEPLSEDASKKETDQAKPPEKR